VPFFYAPSIEKPTYEEVERYKHLLTSGAGKGVHDT